MADKYVHCLQNPDPTRRSPTAPVDNLTALGSLPASGVALGTMRAGLPTMLVDNINWVLCDQSVTQREVDDEIGALVCPGRQR